MAPRLSMKRRSCARALCFRIPMLREVAAAGAALRRSGCTAFRLCLEWILARSDKWLATAIASHFFFVLVVEALAMADARLGRENDLYVYEQADSLACVRCE